MLSGNLHRKTRPFTAHDFYSYRFVAQGFSVIPSTYIFSTHCLLIKLMRSV